MAEVVPDEFLELEQTLAPRPARLPPVIRVKRIGARIADHRRRHMLRPDALQRAAITPRMRRADHDQQAARMISDPSGERLGALGGAALASLHGEDGLARHAEVHQCRDDEVLAVDTTPPKL